MRIGVFSVVKRVVSDSDEQCYEVQKNLAELYNNDLHVPDDRPGM
jgi:hypothetical protein